LLAVDNLLPYFAQPLGVLAALPRKGRANERDTRTQRSRARRPAVCTCNDFRRPSEIDAAGARLRKKALP
jgi:hypothetical protein